MDFILREYLQKQNYLSHSITFNRKILHSGRLYLITGNGIDTYWSISPMSILINFFRVTVTTASYQINY